MTKSGNLRPIRTLVWCAALLLASNGCDTQELQDQFARDASRPASGFTHTTIDGEIISEDEDDWRTSPAYRGVLRIDPAYPNPVSTGQVHVAVWVTDSSRVRGGFQLRAYRGTNLVALGERITQTDPGFHILRFSAGELVTRGLHRVYVFDLFGELISYGDVMVE